MMWRLYFTFVNCLQYLEIMSEILVMPSSPDSGDGSLSRLEFAGSIPRSGTIHKLSVTVDHRLLVSPLGKACPGKVCFG